MSNKKAQLNQHSNKKLSKSKIILCKIKNLLHFLDLDSTFSAHPLENLKLLLGSFSYF